MNYVELDRQIALFLGWRDFKDSNVPPRLAGIPPGICTAGCRKEQHGAHLTMLLPRYSEWLVITYGLIVSGIGVYDQDTGKKGARYAVKVGRWIGVGPLLDEALLDAAKKIPNSEWKKYRSNLFD